MEVVEKQEKRKRHREQHRGNYEIVNDILRFVASKYNCNIAEVTFGASLTYYQQKRYLSQSQITAKAMKSVFYVEDICRYSQK
ncbi:MAG: hypothetical protein GEU26_04750 [Nitrososphaeraceae archaeon]|nr:hypothetical protein [Nitrososphaeraceae archaeon]